MTRSMLSLLFTGFLIPAVFFSSETGHSVSVNRQEKFTAAQIEFFEIKVRPLLIEHCYECHGPDADPPEGGLSLLSRKSILAGGDSGPAIDLENLAESNLLAAVQYGDLFQMPPDSKLADKQIEILEKWVMDKAPWPADSDIDVATGEEFDLQKRVDDHWCWKPIGTPTPPDVANQDWPLDPIDNFILSKLEQSALNPADPADKRTWLRRVTFDITGLPPTLDEINDFLNDNSGEAFETVVDRLLASPRYGERWARHWMDLIRYAETCGHEFDYPNPNAFRYRDYLIRAFNADVPYKDFVVEHIAGDLIENPRRNPENQINESVLGTGFWFLGEATHGPVDVKGDEAGRIDNQIDVMGKTFLGLTIACARCHDHKFDAISAEDYYAISGFLQSSRRQNVMLDPDRKIEEEWNQAQAVARRVSDQYKDTFLIHVLQLEDCTEEFAKHILPAILFLQDNKHLLIPVESRVEGESLVNNSSGDGKVTAQGISQWSGGSQLWWTEGKPGDSITIEFQAPRAGNYELAVEWTRARDYGIVEVQVNDIALGNPVDLYAENVSRSGEMILGKFDLNQTTNTLKLAITGKNEKAVDQYMAGIDYLILRKPDHDEESGTQHDDDLNELAENFAVERIQLDRWIMAIADPATEKSSHLFYALRRASESEIDLTSEAADEYFRDLSKQMQDEGREYGRRAPGGIQPDLPLRKWAPTGFAFRGKQGFGVDASDPDHPIPAIAMHSGRSGTRFQGALRSPTFEITKPRINYLVKARNAKIRLIIDGFRMDEYNALLFNGATIDVDTDGQWKWISQAGDLKNYIGHKAFIELIDPGDGYLAVAHLKFADQPPPDSPTPPHLGSLPAPELWKKSREKLSLNSLELMSISVAKMADRIMRQGYGYGQRTNFVYRHKLIPGLDYDEVAGIIAEAQREFAEINKRVPAPQLAIGMTEGSPEDEHVFVRGNHKNLGALVPRRPLSAVSTNGWKLQRTTVWPDSKWEGSGRKELAEHFVSLNHPLIRRVFVNRIWHHLTGQGIVPSVDNFGVLGSKPTHPELLDYLANEFSNENWSIKLMMRRIVLSQTYRMSSTNDVDGAAADPGNDLLYKFRIRRLQGETIRDSILAVSGELDETMYGPSVPIHLTEFMQGRGRPGKSGPLNGNGRRSLYIEVRRNFLSPMMLAFDTPIPFNAIGKRNNSNVPAQALILMNDPLVIDQAEQWATGLLESYPDEDQRLQNAFVSAFGREPTASEIGELSAFLKIQAESWGEEANETRVWTDLCHVLFNLKEFIYIR